MQALSMDRLREAAGLRVLWSPIALAWYSTQISAAGWTMHLAWVNAMLGAASLQRNRDPK